MALERRQHALLEAIVDADENLRQEGRSAEFMLIEGAGGVLGFKPDVPGAMALTPSEADIRDFEAEGYAHVSPSSSPMVSVKFALSADGRSAGKPRAVTADLQNPQRTKAPPSSNDVLAWLHALSASGPGSNILDSGGALINEARAQFGDDHIEAVARALVDLQGEGLLLFDDALAGIDQITLSEQVSGAAEFRLTSAGVDRAQGVRPAATAITQIVQATYAQVAAGDIHNYGSFDELLDRAEEELDRLNGVDATAQDEARGILAKLRSASGTVATGTATSAGGALVGAVLRQLLGLP